LTNENQIICDVNDARFGATHLDKLFRENYENVHFLVNQALTLKVTLLYYFDDV